MLQRKKTVETLEQLYHEDYELKPKFLGIKRWGTPYLRYTNRHLIIKTYKTYPIGIFSDLTQFDFREDSHKNSFGLDRRITDVFGDDTIIPLQVEKEHEDIHDL